MEPLSRRVRLAYFAVFTALFAVLIPLVIFYAEGWRFSADLGLYKTGGIYVSVPYTNVRVSLEGTDIGVTGLLQRNFYIDNLPPATYVVRASRDGDYTWERMVVVEPQLVTDAHVFLAPVEITRMPFVLSAVATSTGKAITGVTLNTYLSLFATTTIDVATTTPIDIRSGIGLVVKNGELFALWTDQNRSLPANFCLRPSKCVIEIALTRGAEVLSAAFYEDGVLYRTPDGIFYTEVDVRPTPRVITVSDVAGADFRIIDGALVIKEGSGLYEVGL